MINKTKTIIWFYKSSIGELQVALPLIKYLKDNNRDIKIFFIFRNKEYYDKIGDINQIIINEMGQVVIGEKAFIWFLINHIKYTTLILTCDSGHTKWSLLASRIIKKNKVIFHHHAYALHGTYKYKDFISSLPENKKDFNLRYGKGSYIILNSSIDSEYYEMQGFKKEMMIPAGAIGYSKSWLDYYKKISYKDSEYKVLKEKLAEFDYKNIFFFPIRDIHDYYLTEDNYKYLINSIFWLAEQNDDSVFLIKPHPRQQNVRLISSKCDTAKNKNVFIVNESTLLLSEISDLTISFWSSAIIDSLSVETPAIEFFRHHKEHPQLCKNAMGELISLYVKYGFCPVYTRKEDVNEFISEKERWKNVFEYSIKNLEKIFLLKNSDEKNLSVKIDEVYKDAENISNKTVFSSVLILIYIIKYFYRKLKNIMRCLE